MKFHFNKNQVINLFNSRSHLIEEYFYCKRQFFLHFIYFYNQYNSDLKIGKAEHENKKLRLAEDTKNIIVPDYIEFKNNFLKQLFFNKLSAFFLLFISEPYC